jgi:hypothetical protein
MGTGPSRENGRRGNGREGETSRITAGRKVSRNDAVTRQAPAATFHHKTADLPRFFHRSQGHPGGFKIDRFPMNYQLVSYVS